jgi:hypothetical protein
LSRSYLSSSKFPQDLPIFSQDLLRFPQDLSSFPQYHPSFSQVSLKLSIIKSKLFLSSSNQGVKLKMDDSGNILVRRYSKSNIYVKGAGASPSEETAIGSEVLKSPNQILEMEKVMKVCEAD